MFTIIHWKTWAIHKLVIHQNALNFGSLANQPNIPASVLQNQ